MTPEERDALLSRVSVPEEGIILYREIPDMSVETINVMVGRMAELSSRWPKFVQILDLSCTTRPSAEIRAAIRGWMKILFPKLTHMAIVYGDNIVIRAVSRFVAHSMDVPSISFHKTAEEALELARRVRR